MKHVCFISPELPPYLSGGCGVATLRFAKELSTRGYQVTVIARQLAGGKIKEKVSDNLVLHRIPTISKRREISHPVFIYRAYNLLKKIHQKQPISILYGQTINSGPAIIAYLFAKYNSIPLIVHGRGIDVEIREKFPFKEISIKTLRQANLVFMLSKDHMVSMQKFMETHKIDRPMYYLSNGIEIQKRLYSNSEDFKLLRKKYDFSKKYFHVLYVGRLDEPKGVIYLLEAALNLPNIFLHIVGEETSGKTEVTEKLKKFVEENPDLNKRVKFYGRVAQSGVFEMMHVSDCFTHPLLTAAGMGNASLEAMAHGLPIIASNIGYFPELIGGKPERGILCAPKDSTQIANAFKFLSENLDKKEIYSKNAIEYVSNHHSWKVIVDEFIKIINKEGLIEE